MDIIQKPKANILFNPSNISLFDLCPARYNYRVNMNKVLPLSFKAPQLDTGLCAHKGLETYYTQLKEGVKFLDRIDAAKMSMRAYAADALESNLTVDTVSPLVDTVLENLDHWRHEDETLEILGVEDPFTYILYEDDNIRIIISGRIDLRVNKPGLGRGADYLNLPIDHKTYSRDGQVIRLSTQFMNYCIATNSSYLYVNRIGLQKSKTADEKHKRIPLSYDDLILQQWKDSAIAVILGSYAECVSTGFWPMNNTSCLKFNRLCEYYEVCESSGREAQEFKLMNNYVDGVHSDPNKRWWED